MLWRIKTKALVHLKSAKNASKTKEELIKVVEREYEEDNRRHDPARSNRFDGILVRKAKLSYEIEPGEEENDDNKGDAQWS